MHGGIATHRYSAQVDSNESTRTVSTEAMTPRVHVRTSLNQYYLLSHPTVTAAMLSVAVTVRVWVRASVRRHLEIRRQHDMTVVEIRHELSPAQV